MQEKLKGGLGILALKVRSQGQICPFLFSLHNQLKYIAT